VERLRTIYDIRIRLVHFPLHPETPEEGITLEQLFAGRGMDIPAMNARMSQLMSNEGLPYGRRTMTFNSRLAQELARWAVKTQPGGDSIHDALFQAYFVAGQNIAQSDTLVRIAEQLGLDAREAKAALESRRFKSAVDTDWQRSRSLGISGVPTFVLGGSALVGAQPYETLEALLLEADVPRRL
jgi:predicted DsbA family dithiol-disulfide isomerase